MPKRNSSRQVKTQNPLYQDLFSKVLNSACQVEKIDNTKSDDIARIMADPDYPTSKEFTQDLIAAVTTAFQVDHKLTPVHKFINVHPHLDKKRVNILPPYTENTAVRVVVVSGSHEIFYCSLLDKLPISQGIFVPMGNGLKITPTHGDFTYDNRDFYDKSKYPGKGLKRPTERRLIVIDYVGETTAQVQDATAKEMGKASEKMIKETSGSGLIQNLLKGIGVKGTDD